MTENVIAGSNRDVHGFHYNFFVIVFSKCNSCSKDKREVQGNNRI